MRHEARIRIGDCEMSNSQAMTIRVALETFCMTLSANGLGDDEIGKSIARGYLENISLIRDHIFASMKEKGAPE